MRTVLILMDSLNRHYLNCYGGSWVKTPNLDRLAGRSTVFDNHWVGSLPCMPARREMMTGRLNFLESPWGPIEAWDNCLPTSLKEQRSVYSHMITDHYHYFHRGGDGYHDLFSSWEFERGQESDVWRPVVDEVQPPEGTRGRSVGRRAYWANQTCADSEDDLSYPTPRCFERAIDFVECNHDADDWHLHLEVFDPHEPFDCPQRYRDMYDDEWTGDLYNWPAYAKLDPEFDTDEAVTHIRKRYAGSLSMADHWLGKFLDKMDKLGMWEDTTVILTTDHGHLLGEHGYWAKNYMFDYAELAHIPLMVYSPNVEGGGRVSSMTTTIDLMPTLMDLHEAKLPKHVHGKSFTHLLTEDNGHHDAVLYGYFGKDISMFDGTHTYTRQPLADSVVHLHTGDLRNCGRSRQELLKAEAGSFLECAEGVPMFRIPRPSYRHADAPDHNLIYDLSQDPSQQHPVRDDQLEAELAERMQVLLKRYDAPACQFTRMGLSG